MGMTALPPVATEEAMVTEGTVVTEETMVMEGAVVTEEAVRTEEAVMTEETVVMEGTIVMGRVQRAITAGTAAKTEMAMMRRKSPNAVAQEQAARRQAKRGMPPQKTKLLRQKNHWQKTPERWGPWPPNHLPKVQARGRQRCLVASIRDSSRPRRNIPALA